MLRLTGTRNFRKELGYYRSLFTLNRGYDIDRTRPMFGRDDREEVKGFR